MKIAISGAGIGGPTLTYWLARAGHSPTLIEAAPQMRTGGYVIDFWGAGYRIAELMGLETAILEAGYQVRELRAVRSDGRVAASVGTQMFSRAAGGRFTSLPRGDLAAILFGALGRRAETIFGDRIVAVDQHRDGVDLALERSGTRRFDLLVGADGLRSGVRRLVFGADRQFEHHLGYAVAAFRLPDYRPRDELVYVLYNAPGRQAARFALRGDRTLFLFVLRADPRELEEAHVSGGGREFLVRQFANAGWECHDILDQVDRAEDFYLDAVSQIRMPRWSEGRTVLIGDAAAAVSLLAGEGSGLAMVEAYVLAGELLRCGGDPAVAFHAYEARLRSMVEAKQRSAERFASFFAPKTPIGIWLRNRLIRLMNLGLVADLSVGRSLRDDVELPRYHFPS